jgi:methylated-DNA-protein-cysteine methyltransferase related protein
MLNIVTMVKKKAAKPKEEPNFFSDVYEVVKLVPRGRVTSYGAIARYLGTGMSARMVGWAMNACHGLKDVPAHRVVNSQGLLTGKAHFGSPTEMEKRLARDGVNVVNDKVVDFNNILWDPGKELI